MLRVVKPIKRCLPDRRPSIVKSLLLLSGLALLLGSALPGFAAEKKPDPIRIATGVLDQLDAGEYAAAEAGFTDTMATAVPAAKLKAIWESLPAQAGMATGRGEPTMKHADGFAVVVIPLHYEKIELVAELAINADGKVAGFFLKPAPPPPPAATAVDASFEERQIMVGYRDKALPGTLAMPESASAAQPVPGVVLVHGSGPLDRNATIGPNHPFLDIARGLAARGIAVLRYDKRNFARPQDFADRDYDIDDVAIDDAVAAVATLRGVDSVDAERIFVLGHSLGGMLAPRIALESDKIAGLVLLAAPARTILDILIEQNRRLAAMDGETSDEEKAAIANLVRQVEQVRTHESVPPADSPMGLPAEYWRSVEAVQPIADAKAAKLPMLLAQGGRDIQVVEADWDLWKKAFADQPDVTMTFYPALNHLGIAGEGPGSLTEYHQPGHVDATLIHDIAEWIHAHD